jgi:lysophospholipase-1
MILLTLVVTYVDIKLVNGSGPLVLTLYQMGFEELQQNQDERGILKSRDYFNTLIKEEIDKGIDPSRIVLGGFSQGGAISLFTGVTNTRKLGGVFGMSSYLLLAERLKEFCPEGELPNQNTPFFLAHGMVDDVVKFEFGDMTQKHLKSLGFDVEFHSYPYVVIAHYPFVSSHEMITRKKNHSDLPHSAEPAEIEDLENFISKVLPPQSEAGAAGL